MNLFTVKSFLNRGGIQAIKGPSRMYATWTDGMFEVVHVCGNSQ